MQTKFCKLVSDGLLSLSIQSIFYCHVKNDCGAELSLELSIGIEKSEDFEAGQELGVGFSWFITL